MSENIKTNSHAYETQALGALRFYKHRLIALEASLHELATRRDLPKKYYEKRAEGLAFMRQTIEELQKILQAKEQSDELPTELAILTRCTKAESELVLKTLWEKMAILHEIDAFVDQAGRIQADALRGRNSYFRTTFRLAKLSKLLQALEAKLRNLQFDDKTLSGFIRRIHGSHPLDRDLAQTRFLVGTFNELSDLGQDISALKQQASAKARRLEIMRDWLRRRKMEMQAQSLKEAAPSFEHLQQLADSPLFQTLDLETKTLKLFKIAHDYRTISSAKGVSAVTTQLVRRKTL